MTKVTIKEAEAQLASLLERAASGEEVVITGDDGTVFELVLGAPNTPRRRGLVGSAKDKVRLAPDFDDIPDDFKPYLG